MTLRELEQATKIEAHIRAVEYRIKCIECSIPTGSGSGSSQPGNPTERKAIKIIKLRAEIEGMEKQLSEIDAWIESLTEPQLKAIATYIRCGKTWGETSSLVYGVGTDRSVAFHRISRFIESGNNGNK